MISSLFPLVLRVRGWNIDRYFLPAGFQAARQRFACLIGNLWSIIEMDADENNGGEIFGDGGSIDEVFEGFTLEKLKETGF